MSNVTFSSEIKKEKLEVSPIIKLIVYLTSNSTIYNILQRRPMFYLWKTCLVGLFICMTNSSRGESNGNKWKRMVKEKEKLTVEMEAKINNL